MSNTNVAVKRNGSENVLSLVRRFQKKVQESGVLPRVRSLRYAERGLSDLKVKKAKLTKLKKAAKYEHDRKMGKVVIYKKKR